MIVKRWGKYTAVETFADVAEGDVIDVTGVTERDHQIMWVCNKRVSDWHDWDIPVLPVENQPHEQSDIMQRSRRNVASDARLGELTAFAVIALLKEHAAAGEQGAIEALAELRKESLTLERPSSVDTPMNYSDMKGVSLIHNGHPKCDSCPFGKGWDSSGLGFCTQPLGISTLFDENVRFPITDEQYCSHHPEARK